MTQKNFRARVNQVLGVLFMVLVAVIAASCGKEPVDNWAEAGVLKVSSKPLNGESYDFNSYAVDGGAQLDGEWLKTTDAVPTDSAKASATIQAQVELEKAEIEINTTLKNNNVWSFDSISQPVATASGYKWNGYMTKNDGQKAVFTFNSKTAALRDLVIGLEPVALRADSTKNTATTARSGEKERMTTVEYFTATVKESGTSRSNTVDIPLSATYMRYIPEGAPEIVDSIIDWTDDLEFRSGLWALANSDKAQVKVIYLLSDGSRVDGPSFAKEAPRTMWGSEDKIYVSEFEKSIGANFSGSASEGEATDAELSDKNWTVSFETVRRSWRHEQKSVDGKNAVTSLFVKAPHFVFNHGALRHDFGRLPLNVEKTEVKVEDKEPVVEDGKSYEVKQLRNTIDTNYGVDSTGVVAQQVISTVDLLKLNVAVVRDSTSAEMAQEWLSSQVNYTWNMTRWFSNGTQTHFDVKQAIARTITTNDWEATEFKKALTAGAARVKSQSESAKTINGVAEDGTKYTINYTDVETIYEWNNTLHSGKVVVSTATTHNPKNVRLTIDDRTFTQKGVTMKYNRGEAVLGDAEYNDGKTQVYPYSCVLTESVEGYAQSALAKAATGKLTVNAAKVVDFKIISKNDYFIGYKRFIDLRIKYIYSDGTDKQLDKHFELAGNGSSVKCVSTEEVVSERLLSVVAPTLVSAQAGRQNNFSYNLSQFSHNRGTERGSGSLEYKYSYSYPTEVKYAEEIDGVKIEVSFENPITDVNFETSDFTKESEQAVEGGTTEKWTRPMNMILTLGAGNNNTIANQGIIYKFEAAQEVPEAPAAVIGRGIVSPKQGLTDNMYYVGYLLKLNNGKVRPLIVDKNGQNVELGEEFDANAAWNGAAYINGTLYPVLGADQGGMLKYTHKKGVSYAISAVNAGDGFNWNHATVENVTDHYKPVIKKQGGKTILTLEKVYNWSMSF